MIKKRMASLALGLLFGVGLTMSGMLQPQKVQDFLDFSDIKGRWDPSLALVMGGAVLITLLSFPMILRRSHPVVGTKFHVPTLNHLDFKLATGAALFGIGWGLGGFCPGPALVSLVTGSRAALVFVAAMVAGMALHRVYHDLRQQQSHS